MKLALIGRLDDLALRVGHQAAHAGQLADLLERATGTRVGHHEDGVELVEVRDHRLGDLVGRGIPLLDDRLVALLLRDQPVGDLARDVGDQRVELVEDVLLLGRHDDIVLEIVIPAWVAYLKPRSLNASSTSEIVVAP